MKLTSENYQNILKQGAEQFALVDSFKCAGNVIYAQLVKKSERKGYIEGKTVTVTNFAMQCDFNPVAICDFANSVYEKY